VIRLIQKYQPGTLKWECVPLRKKYFQFGLLSIAFLVLYLPVMGLLVSSWLASNVHSYGFLVPFISLYLVWIKRKTLQQLQVKPSTLWGILIMLFAGLILVLGKAGGLGILQQLSLTVMIIGLILLLLGKTYLKELSFPVAYLFLMIPFLEDVLAPLHWPFQLLTAKQGVALLELMGFPALVEQQFIFLPHITLEVARVCSGINSLISIIAIGLPLAYLILRTWWGRVTLLLVGLVIGVMSNWLRVVLIAVWTYSGNFAMHGPFHIFQGMFAAWVGYAALFAGAWVLSRLEKNPIDFLR